MFNSFRQNSNFRRVGNEARRKYGRFKKNAPRLKVDEIYHLVKTARVNLEDLCESCKSGYEVNIDGLAKGHFIDITHKMRKEAFKIGKEILRKNFPECRLLDEYAHMRLEDYIVFCEGCVRENENLKRRDEMLNAIHNSRVVLGISYHLKAMRAACENDLCSEVKRYFNKFKRIENKYGNNAHL